VLANVMARAPADTIVSAGARAITFASTVNGAKSLRAATTGITTFGGVVGGTTPLVKLSTNVGGTTSLGGNVTTTDSQIYNDAVTLATDTTLTGSATLTGGVAGVAIAFRNTVDGTKSLTLQGGAGKIAFDKAVGGNTPLASLQVTQGAGMTAAAPVTLDGSNKQVNGLVIANVNNVVMTAAGSSIKNYSTSGIQLNATKNSTLSGFTVSGIASRAINVLTGDYTGTKITGNTFETSTNGIWLEAARNITINSGNKVAKNTTYGLYASGDSVGTSVTGNTISENGINIDTSQATGGTFQQS